MSSGRNDGRGGSRPPSYHIICTAGLPRPRAANSYCTIVESGYDAGVLLPPPHGVDDALMLVG